MSNLLSAPPYYIPRKLTLRRFISPNIFHRGSSDISAVEDIERHELSRLVPGGTERSSNITMPVSVRFILLEDDLHFHKICRHASENVSVHHLRWCGRNKGLQWRKTEGSMGLIQKCLLPDEDVMDEDAFLEQTIGGKAPVVISDSGGMGKTTLLSNLAAMIRDKFPTKVVHLLELSGVSFKTTLSWMMTTSPEQWFERMVTEVGERDLILEAMKSNNCVFLLDAFDELAKGEKSVVQQLVTLLCHNWSTKVYLTTRPSETAALESSFGVLSYSISPFEAADQEAFLVQFWTSRGATQSDSLLQFARACLTSIKVNLEEDHRQIAGIPLQCAILAEIHEDDALAINSTPPETITARNLSLFEMYSRFVDHCFTKLEAKVPPGSRDGVRTWIENTHKFHAVHLLHPHLAEEFRSLLLDFEGPWSQDDVLTSGILDGSLNGVPRFVHRTLAEFLVAELTSELLSLDDHRSTHLLSALTATTETRVVFHHQLKHSTTIDVTAFVFPEQCYFLNTFLQRSGHQAKWHLSDTQFQSVFMAAVRDDFVGLGKLVATSSKAEADWISICLLAAGRAGLEFWTLIHQIDPFDTPLATVAWPTETERNCTVTITPLLLAVKVGHFEVTEFLLKCGFEELLQTHHPSIRYLLHFCVEASLKDSQSVIQAKAKIVHLLTQKCGRLIEEELFGKAALLETHVDVGLIQALLQVGADVNQVDAHKLDVLHYFFERQYELSVTPAQFHDLVVTLADFGFQRFDKRRVDGEFLHHALKHLEVTPETIDILLEHNVDLQHRSTGATGDFILHTAVRAGRSLSLIQKLVSAGANLGAKNNLMETVSHVSVASGHLEALRYFCAKGVPLNEVDVNLNNELHVAMTLKTENRAEILLELIYKYGVSPSATNNKGQTPFVLGCQENPGSLSVALVKLMEVKSKTILITPTSATAGIKGILAHLQKGSVGLPEWNSGLRDLVAYLIRKGGVVHDAEIPGAVKNELSKLLHVTSPSTDDFQRFEGALPELVLFLESSSRVLVVRSRDPETTLRRITDVEVGTEVDLGTIAMLDTLRDREGSLVVVRSLEEEIRSGVEVIRRRYSRRKFVFVADHSLDGGGLNVVEDLLGWNDLTPGFQAKVLRFVEVLFQGSSLPLKDLPKLSSEELFVLMKAYRTTSHLTEELQSKFEGIPMKFAPRTKLSDDIFDHFLPDIFVFREELEDLQKLARWGQTVAKFDRENQSEAKVNFWSVEDESDFDRICAHLLPHSGECVHLLQNCPEDGTYHIRRSYGSVRNVARFLLPSTSIRLTTEQVLAETETDPVVLVQVPDDVETKALVQALKAEHLQNAVVLTIRSGALKAAAERLQDQALSSEEALLHILGSTPEERALFKVLVLEKELRVIFHLQQGQTEMDAFPILETLSLNGKAGRSNLRWWVTTTADPVDLQMRFGVKGYHLLPFDEGDKVNFIQSLWSHAYHSEEGTRWAELCLRSFERTFPLAEFSNYFTQTWEINCPGVARTSPVSNPHFYCRLLGKLFEPEAGFSEAPAMPSISRLLERYVSLSEEPVRLPEIDFYLETAAILRRCFDRFKSCHPVTLQMLGGDSFQNIEGDVLDSCVLSGFSSVPLAVEWALGLGTNPPPNLDDPPAPLVDVIRFGDFTLVKLVTELYKNAAKENYAKFCGSLLTSAVKRGEPSIVDHLISQGCQPSGNLLLHHCLNYSSVDQEEFVEKRNRLIENLHNRWSSDWAREVNAKDARRNTPLHRPQVHLSHIKLLICLGGDPKAVNDLGQTFLHTAVLSPADFHDLVEHLLENGLGDSFHISNKEGETALHHAIHHRMLLPKTLELLAPTLDPNASTTAGDTMLDLAIRAHSGLSLIHTLISLGAEWRTEEGGSGVLHAAASSGNPSALNFFVHHLGCLEVNARDDEGNTPLHCVFPGKSGVTVLDTVRTLVTLGAEVNARREDGKGLLHLARCHSSQGLIDVVKFLAVQGADLALEDDAGNTMVHTSPQNRDPEYFMGVVHFLLDNSLGDLLQKRNGNGALPLHLAVWALELGEEALTTLATYNDVNSLDGNRFPVLFYAILGERSEKVVRSLVQLGADVNLRGYEGNSPLHMAAAKPNATFVRFLVERGGDVNARAEDNSTPLMAALASSGEGTEEIVDILLEAGRVAGEVHSTDYIEGAVNLALKAVELGRLSAAVVAKLRECV